VNQVRRDLKPEFHIDKPYELVSANKTSQPFWIGFSGVGFTDEKTVAVVSVDKVFPRLRNSSGILVVLFKKDGKWQPREIVWRTLCLGIVTNRPWLP